MDVANINKSYTDPVAGGKNGSSGDQLMADFSAAVAARMSTVGSKTAEQGKNALTNHLTAKTHVATAKEDSAPPPREDVTDALPTRRADDRADNAPADTSHDDHADDYHAPANAPRDAASHDDRDGAVHSDASDNEPKTASDAPRDGEHHDAQNAPDEGTVATQGESQTTTASDGAADPNMTAAVLSVDTGKAEQTLSTVAAKAETAVTATGDNAPKQNALNGLNTAQDAAAKNNAIPGDAQNGDELQADVNAKGKRGSQQAAATPQAAQNASQTKGEGATTAQQQAADMSRAIGQEHRLNVNVNVTKQANELTSQPTQNLTAQVMQTAEDDGAATNTAQVVGKGQGVKLTPTPNTGQNGTDGQPQGQSQNQNQAQAQGLMQAQIQSTQGDAAKVATGGEAKSVSVQAASTANTAQTVKAGGAEVTTPTPSATQTTTSTQTHQASAPAKPQATPHTPARAQVTDQVTVQISKAIADGMDSIRIQLKPAHLGRVDVSLEMSQDGRVSAVVTADNKDTLDLLKQDSRELQKALRDAGLQMDSNDLSFNLRGEGGKANNGQETAQSGSAKSASPLSEPSLDELLQAQPAHKNIITKDRVDITA
ncbi:MAG TPA: flagellar hook-length control protein FliK [Magnetovibrio sp.]